MSERRRWVNMIELKQYRKSDAHDAQKVAKTTHLSIPLLHTLLHLRILRFGNQETTILKNIQKVK